MYTARYQKYVMNFIHPGGTSRGVMYNRTSWFLILKDGPFTGIGECAPLDGLSRDNVSDIEKTLDWVCLNINNGDLLDEPSLWQFPSILFALETAFLDVKNAGKRLIFDNDFFKGKSGIQINGLIWMSDVYDMRIQVKQKINEAFDCIKIKISSANIDNELAFIKEIRNTYGNNIEIRVDANGAFTFENCKKILDKLAALKVHSIEQPIPSGEFLANAEICRNSPIPIALDEDIIHWDDQYNKYELLDKIKPQYVILKPGLLGGFKETTEWINLAVQRNIGWWITSALESNIGLNAIAQYTANWEIELKQGLGTGKVFDNNIQSPLKIVNGAIIYDTLEMWDLKNLNI